MNSFYTQYYTASDCTVTLIKNKPVYKEIQLDLTLAIGYRHSLSSMPIYSLGYSEPQFFSKGNSIGHGNLELAFKSQKYLKNAINYLIGEVNVEELKQELSKKALNNSVSNDELKLLSSLINTKTYNMESISILDISQLFDIRLDFNYTNSNSTDTTKSIILSDVKFIDQQLGVSSSDDNILRDSYKFMFKNVR